MQVRCQNCGARLSVPPGDLREVKCPRCGVLMMMPPPREVRDEPRRSRASLKRVFDPIPRPMVYLAGAGIALLLTSPFWIYVLKERFSRNPPLLSDDSHQIILPPLTNSAAPAVPLLGEGDSSTLTFDGFRGVRLDVGRDDLQRAFNLRLQNTRGMVPEIYDAERVGEVELLTAYFYGNALKEFSLVMRERREGPDGIQQELVGQFGEPQQVDDALNAASGIGLGLPGLGGGGAAVAQKLAAYPNRRDLSWADNQNRIEATIYYSTNAAMLSVRVAAAAWLKVNHPLVNSVTPAITNALDRPVLPASAAHAFP